MKKINCPNCASATFKDIGFDKYICQYCGTIVMVDNDKVFRLEVVRKDVVFREISVVLCREAKELLIERGDLDKYLHKEIADKLAKDIVGTTPVTEYYEPYINSYIYRTKIGIVI